MRDATDTLRTLLDRALGDPETLAHYLAGYDLQRLCLRLGCDEETAIRLQLRPAPDAYGWRRGVCAIAAAHGLDAGRLRSLLDEAIGGSGARVGEAGASYAPSVPMTPLQKPCAICGRVFKTTDWYTRWCSVECERTFLALPALAGSDGVGRPGAGSAA